MDLFSFNRASKCAPHCSIALFWSTNSQTPNRATCAPLALRPNPAKTHLASTRCPAQAHQPSHQTVDCYLCVLQLGYAGRQHHGKQIDEQRGFRAQYVVGLHAQLDKRLKVVAVFAAQHFGEIGRQHKSGLFALDAKLLLVIAKKMTCVLKTVKLSDRKSKSGTKINVKQSAAALNHDIVVVSITNAQNISLAGTTMSENEISNVELTATQ